MFLVRQIVAQMRGEISVSSKIGAGTRISLSLPTASRSSLPASSPVAAKPRPAPDARALRVLIVEDEDFIADANSCIVRKVFPNAAVDVVANGEDARRLALAACYAYDLVIMDATLDGAWTGQETTSHLLEDNPDLLIASCSASGEHFDGARLSWSKPLSWRKVAKDVGGALAAAASQGRIHGGEGEDARPRYV